MKPNTQFKKQIYYKVGDNKDKSDVIYCLGIVQSYNTLSFIQTFLLQRLFLILVSFIYKKSSFIPFLSLENYF